MRYILSIALVIILNTAFASKIIVDDSNYANKTLTFYRFSDPITKSKKKLFTLNIDDKGQALHIFNNHQTTQLVCEFGVYQGFLFLKKDDVVTLKLPPVQEKTIADRKNPFFKPIEFLLMVEPEDNLNNQLVNFYSTFNRLIDENFQSLFMQSSRKHFDQIKLQLNTDFKDVEDDVFNRNMQYQLLLLEMDIFRKNTQSIASKLGSVNNKYWNYSSFIELFNKLFDRKFVYELQNSSSINLPKVIYDLDINSLKNYISTQYKISGDLNDLIVLKFLYDGYYSDKFDNARIIKMIKKQRFLKHKNQEIVTITDSILNKISFLNVGTKAPIICLDNLNDQKVCTNGSAKFKYIIFADIDIMVNREQLKYLSELHNQFGDKIDFYTIVRPSIDGVYKFFQTNDIPGEKMIDVDNKFIESYKIPTFPYAILLDENHKVVFKNTKTPLDGFEHQLVELLKNK